MKKEGIQTRKRKQKSSSSNQATISSLSNVEQLNVTASSSVSRASKSGKTGKSSEKKSKKSQNSASSSSSSATASVEVSANLNGNGGMSVMPNSVYSQPLNIVQTSDTYLKSSSKMTESVNLNQRSMLLHNNQE